MRRTHAAILATLLTIAAACSDNSSEAEDSSSSEPGEYQAFENVDTHTSPYFIELEDTGLIEDQGEQRLYNLGINVCTRLDAGQTVEENMADDAGLGDSWGSVVGAAVADLCPHHGDAVEAYLAANS